MCIYVFIAYSLLPTRLRLQGQLAGRAPLGGPLRFGDKPIAIHASCDYHQVAV